MVAARIPIIAVLLAIAGTVVFVVVRAPSQPLREPPAAVNRAVAAGAVVHEVRQVAMPPASVEPVVVPVKLAASQRVATVNGTVITGRQLLAWRGRDPGEQEMTPEMFASLKHRAIERELTFEE